MATGFNVEQSRVCKGEGGHPVHRLSHVAHEAPTEEEVREGNNPLTHFTAHDDNSRSANGELGNPRMGVTAKLRAPVFNISLYFVASTIHSY